MKNRKARFLVALCRQKLSGHTKHIEFRCSNRSVENFLFDRYGEIINHYAFRIKQSRSRWQKCGPVFTQYELDSMIAPDFKNIASLDLVKFNGDGTADVSIGFITSPGATCSWNNMDKDQIVAEIQSICAKLREFTPKEDISHGINPWTAATATATLDKTAHIIKWPENFQPKEGDEVHRRPI